MRKQQKLGGQKLGGQATTWNKNWQTTWNKNWPYFDSWNKNSSSRSERKNR